jgi:hypothetical protein
MSPHSVMAPDSVVYNRRLNHDAVHIYLVIAKLSPDRLVSKPVGHGVAAPDSVVYDRGLGSEAVRVYLALAKHDCEVEGGSPLELGLVASRLGIKPRKSLLRPIRKLIARGHIEPTQNERGGYARLRPVERQTEGEHYDPHLPIDEEGGAD